MPFIVSRETKATKQNFVVLLVFVLKTFCLKIGENKYKNVSRETKRVFNTNKNIKRFCSFCVGF